MNSAWQMESGRLTRRWSGVPEYSPYRPRRHQQESESLQGNILQLLPDFAAHSPLGSGEWIVPWNLRWSLPTQPSETWRPSAPALTASPTHLPPQKQKKPSKSRRSW